MTKTYEVRDTEHAFILESDSGTDWSIEKTRWPYDTPPTPMDFKRHYSYAYPPASFEIALNKYMLKQIATANFPIEAFPEEENFKEEFNGIDVITDPRLDENQAYFISKYGNAYIGSLQEVSYNSPVITVTHQEANNLCSCSLDTIMDQGCQCGGV